MKVLVFICCVAMAGFVPSTHNAKFNRLIEWATGDA